MWPEKTLRFFNVNLKCCNHDLIFLKDNHKELKDRVQKRLFFSSGEKDAIVQTVLHFPCFSFASF